MAVEREAAEVTQESPVVTLNASAQWTCGVQSAVKVRDFTPFIADEPEVLGGTDKGPNPMEYVVGSLVSCLAVMIRLIADEQGFTFSDLKLDAEGDIDTRGLFGTAEVRPHFTEVRGVIEIETTESEERLAAVREQVTKRCPAYNLLKAAGSEPNLEWKIRRPA